MQNATLVWSSRDHDRSNILTFTDGVSDTSNKLMESIFKGRTTRLTITKNKYFYAPSEDYKQHVVRFKRIK
jgi:hypothetical protein